MLNIQIHHDKGSGILSNVKYLPGQFHCNLSWKYISDNVVVCIDLSGKETYRQVGVDGMIATGNLESLMV